jgi:hypothetical protein
MRKVGRAVAVASAGLAWLMPLGAAEIGGRYATPAAQVAPANTVTSTQPDMRLVEITRRRGNAYALVYASGANARKRRGWGLLDGDELAVSLATGGPAYGVAIYQHAPAEHAWSGPWISSLDGGGTASGRIRFEDGAGLAGRHALECTRPGAGSVSGTVDIKPAGDGFQLIFRLGRAVCYRGVGLPLPGDRLAVGWSFGSAPELATYAVTAAGALAEHRLAWTPQPGAPADGQFTPVNDDQYFAAMHRGQAGLWSGSTALPLFAPAAAGAPPDTAAEAAAQTIMGLAAPQVKAWSYGALQRQYGADGWAQRWLESQLDAEELNFLRAALRRHAVHGVADQELENRSIGTLIEEERARPERR